ncbi:Acyltransferase family protein [Rubripirellula lacrimiformis]|uniref:Acyltransferase family protein n=2 Tax=Rubripirellula lacrimiformis TaxID=1930273 RepID=A0A517NH68_9BACT|nr:Acyltransferase family protein [Rubripirellula lacrimiformis]
MRIEGIDWLRAWMSVSVVVWHMMIVPHSDVFSADEFTQHAFGVSDFVNFHVLLAAVPTFMAVACFLFARKTQSLSTLKSSLRRVILLLAFWPLAMKLWEGSVGELIDSIPRSPLPLLEYVFRAGNTLYYFFSCLLFCYVLCYLAARLKTRWISCAWIASVIGVELMPLAAQQFRIPLLAAYWNPLNFAPYALGAVLLARWEKSEAFRHNRSRVAVACVVFATLLAAIEWRWMLDSIHFQYNQCAFPQYTRSSLVFTAFGLLIAACNPAIRTNVVVSYLAATSLSLYCLHLFFVPVADKLIDPEDVSVVGSILRLVVVLVLSNVAFHVGKLFLKKELLC